jgi:hypothetical protein
MQVSISFDQHGHPYTDARQSPRWQPHLPGADCFALMAAARIDAEWESDTGVRAWSYHDSVVFIREGHTNTLESKATALASAVFQCAVRVAMEAKR